MQNFHACMKKVMLRYRLSYLKIEKGVNSLQFTPFSIFK